MLLLLLLLLLLFLVDFFCQATPYALKFEFKYNLNLFLSCGLFDFSFFSLNFLSLCIHFLAAGLRPESVLVPSVTCLLASSSENAKRAAGREEMGEQIG